MTNEEKQLLLKVLCAELPYGVIVHFYDINVDGYDRQLIGEDLDYLDLYIKRCKPYLRPLSSMTEEEINEFILISDTTLWLGNKRSTCILSLKQMDWLDKKMFDYRGLIPMGLALEAKEGMYK